MIIAISDEHILFLRIGGPWDCVAASSSDLGTDGLGGGQKVRDEFVLNENDFENYFLNNSEHNKRS